MTNKAIRMLLRPVAQIAGLHAAREDRAFQRSHARGRQVQDELLARLVAHHAETRFGRDHTLSAVRTYDDFRQAVPLGDYESLRPWLDDVYEGHTNAMFPPDTTVHMFALTSGTTGRPKRIPVTTEFLAGYRRGWNIFGIRMLRDHRRAWLRKILQVSSPACESLSPTGLPCGAISGALAATQKRIVRLMYPVPREIFSLADATDKYYTIMRLAVPEDVAILTTANPSTVVQLLAVANAHIESLLRDLRDGTLSPPGGERPERRLRPRKHPALVRRIERGLATDGELRCPHFWNLDVCAHWTGGTLSLYRPAVRRLIGDAAIRDIGLLASEGRFTIPLADDTPAGPADILGNFLEFIPADEIDSLSPTILRSHELSVGAEYFLVLTNWAGLWRYNINDRVRVTGYVAQTPMLAFLSKGDHTTSLTGEKLTEHQVVSAVREATERLRLEISRFVAQPHFGSTPYYQITIESPGDPPAPLAATIDEAIGTLNVEYASKRKSGRLGAVRLTTASCAEFDQRQAELLANRSGRIEQYKHQYLLTDVVNEAVSMESNA